jgi:hypothetical protein
MVRLRPAINCAISQTVNRKLRGRRPGGHNGDVKSAPRLARPRELLGPIGANYVGLNGDMLDRSACEVHYSG